MSGHAIIINMTTGVPFVFEYNPEKIKSKKKINYIVAPNIGGSHKKRYFAGFDSKEVSFFIKCIDMESPLGVKPQVSYFEQLRNPDAGPNIAASFSVFGNENYPPPKILFQFAISYIPVVWQVLDIEIELENFHDDVVRGIIGVPRVATINIQLALEEDHVLNKANQIAEKVGFILGGIESVAREGWHQRFGGRKESWSIPKITV